MHKIKEVNYKKYPKFRPINRCLNLIYRWSGNVRKVFLSPSNLCVKRTINSEVKIRSKFSVFLYSIALVNSPIIVLIKLKFRPVSLNIGQTCALYQQGKKHWVSLDIESIRLSLFMGQIYFCCQYFYQCGYLLRSQTDLKLSYINEILIWIIAAEPVCRCL